MKNLTQKITVTILTILFMGSSALAQNGASNENAMVKDADSEKIKWGPCPSFMGDGCNIAVLHGNPKKPNTDILFKMEGNSSVPRHWHHSPERMVLISGKMTVDYDGQEKEVVNVGNYAYGPAERPHMASCISDEPCVLFIAFEDPIDAKPISKTD